ILFLALVESTTAGEARSAATAVPQPRVRLDPVSRTAAIIPATEIRKEPNAPVVVMDKFIVKEPGGVPPEPSQEEGPQGRFSLVGGGYLMKGNIGKAQWEVGVWPWLPKTDVFAKEQIFKPQKSRIDWDLVRFHW